MEQPKKPGPTPTRDIADLKARLGLAKNPASAGGAAPFPGAVRPPGAAPSPFGAPLPGARMPGTIPPPVAAPPMAPAAPPPEAYDPYASMKPPAGGRGFDLRPVDDGVPAENVRSRGGKMLLVFAAVAGAGGLALGYGFGAAAVGQTSYNRANSAAKDIKKQLDDMQKTLTQVGTAVAMSQDRLGKASRDQLSYDARLIEDLEKIKLEPRPETSAIFRTDYARLSDIAVDRLMHYYYDSIALYGEVERHIKRTKADQPQLEAYLDKQGEKADVNYGVVFDGRGKIAIGSLVEMGAPICKGGGRDCGADSIEGFQIRSNTGAPWVQRRIGAKPEPDKVVPLERSPLMEAVMSGSLDQVRMEQYRQRYQNIRMTLTRLTAAKKGLFEEIDKAATRPDLSAWMPVPPGAGI